MRDIYYRSKTLGEVTLRGASRASIQSFWNIPEWDLGLDAGGHPWDLTPQLGRLFISHTHRDHIQGLYQLIARRKKRKLPPPEIYVPAESEDVVRRFLEVWQEMDGARYPFRLQGLTPGDTVLWETENGQRLQAKAVRSFHRIPSLGYLIYGEKGTPLLAYTGDSLPALLDKVPAFYQAEILIMEMTSADMYYTPEEIHKFGHTHFLDVLERRENFANRWIIISHFTCKRSMDLLCRHTAEAFPDRLGGRLIVW
ncbi:MAG: ribonuclease Z [Thermoguttaceae bacterium]|nr:ribonuclease Z [Thermoguttaceae bacterium]